MYQHFSYYVYQNSKQHCYCRWVGEGVIFSFTYLTLLLRAQRELDFPQKRLYEMFFVQMFTFPVQCHFFAQLIVSQCQCIGQVFLHWWHWCILTQGNIFMFCSRKHWSSLSLSDNMTSLQLPLSVMFITWQNGISQMQKCPNMQVGFS